MVETNLSGFSGITNLASSIDAELARLAGPPESYNQPNEPAAHGNHTPPSGPIPHDGARTRTGLLIAGAAVLIVWFVVANFRSFTGSSTAPSYQSAYATEPQAAVASSDVPVENTDESIAEDMPPPAVGAALTTNQIAYCLAQQIRIEGAKSAVDSEVPADVDRFNALVTDYNSRCAQFNYNQSAMTAAQTYAEQNRSALLAAGREQFPPTATYQPTEPAPAAPPAEEATQSDPDQSAQPAVPTEAENK